MVLHSKKICPQSKCSQTIEWSWFLLGTLKFNHLYDTQGNNSKTHTYKYKLLLFRFSNGLYFETQRRVHEKFLFILR